MNLQIVFLAFLFTCQFSHSQQKNRLHDQYRFTSITVDEGLNNNRVRAVAQDKNGYIWFGTRTGISKYNGYSINNYDYYCTDSTEEKFRQVRELFFDSHNNLWVVGENGICIYNPILNRFDHLDDPENKGRITKTVGVDEDSKGLLWFTNAHEILNYNPVTEEFNYFEPNPEKPNSLPYGLPEKILLDRDDNVWIGYQDIGVVYYQRDEKVFTHFAPDGNPGSLADNFIERLYEDQDGNIWVGYNNNGFSKFIPEPRTFKTYFPDPENKESGRVRGILKDKKGNFWIGTMAGLYLFDEFNESFKWYAHSNHPVSELSHNSIQCIFQDKQEGLWMGTHAGGVCYTNLNTSGFVRYDYSPIQSPYFLNDKNVYSLAINYDGNIWIGTEKGGLNYLDRETGKFSWLVSDPNDDNTPLSNNIKDIKVDDRNNIWFATYGGGFSFYDVENKKFTHYLRSEKNPDGFPISRIYSLYPDPYETEHIWLGAIDGLYMYNYRTKDYLKISPGISEFSNAPEFSSQINTFYHLNGKLIIGTDKLAVLSLEDKSFSVINQVNDISISSVNFIHADKKGFIWFDLNNVYLVRADADFNDFKILSVHEGLPDLNYYEAADDQSGDLWLSTNKGIVQLQNIINNQDTVVARVFTKSDNLQSIEFLYHSKAVSNDGEIFFGGINGFNSFYPENVVTNPYPPQVLITALEVGNKPVNVNEKVRGRVLINKPVEETKSLKIHHRIKSFTLRFDGLHYVSPENNRFAYKLEGHDEEWIETDASVRFVSYSNLHGGTYIFKLKASNINGLWSEHEVQLIIDVIPAFWKRWWFYALVVIIAAILIMYFIRQREQQLKQDKLLLEAKLKEGEAEINNRKHEIEQQKRAIEEKDKAEEVNRWTNEGLAVFSSILNKEKNDLKKLSRLLISQITKYTGSQQGGIYISENVGDSKVQIKLYGYYAFNAEKLEKVIFMPGEGLIGTSFQQQETIEMDHLPETYAKLNSGLGATALRYLLIIPLVHDNESVGIIEIVSIEKLEPHKVDFIVKLSESIASVVSSVKSNNLINEMLVKTQEQSEELHAQEEEMRQTMEEMRATQENIQAHERNMHSEIEDLRKKVNELNRMNEEQKNRIKELSKK
ncbi:MAG: GAF domain-containing protein [Bacteroidales bacterium]|nr:GAF domain-containing protein [Bacteroidales bacterium]